MTVFKRRVVLTLSIAWACLSFGNVQAAIVSNDQIIHDVYQVNDSQTLLATLSRADVQQQLSSMGVNAVDIESRINSMTHEEIVQLNQQITELPAGAGVLGVVVTVFIVFVITDVIGATDIFPFIRPIN